VREVTRPLEFQNKDAQIEPLVEKKPFSIIESTMPEEDGWKDIGGGF
jgi:hypothetical protein